MFVNLNLNSVPKNISEAMPVCHNQNYLSLKTCIEVLKALFFSFSVISKRRRFTNHPNRLVNQGKIKVNEQKRHSAFLRAEHFYFQDRYLFSCVDPLLLCYRVLNMGRVALF